MPKSRKVLKLLCGCAADSLHCAFCNRCLDHPDPDCLCQDLKKLRALLSKGQQMIAELEKLRGKIMDDHAK